MKIIGDNLSLCALTAGCIIFLTIITYFWQIYLLRMTIEDMNMFEPDKTSIVDLLMSATAFPVVWLHGEATKEQKHDTATD